MRIRKWHIAGLVGVLLLTAGLGFGASVVRGAGGAKPHPAGSLTGKVNVTANNGGCAVMGADTATNVVALPINAVAPTVVNSVTVTLPCDSHVLTNWDSEIGGNTVLISAEIFATCVAPGSAGGCVPGTVRSCSPGGSGPGAGVFMLDTTSLGEFFEASLARKGLCTNLRRGVWEFDVSAEELTITQTAFVDFRAFFVQAYGTGVSGITPRTETGDGH